MAMAHDERVECGCHACTTDRALRAAGVDQQRLLSRERTAEVLSVSPDMVDELYNSGRLAGLFVGRRRLHSIQAIERFITDNEAFYGA